MISELLNVKPAERATAADVLNHPWMKADKKLLKMQNLAKSQVTLKKTLAKQRFRKAIHTVRTEVPKSASIFVFLYYVHATTGGCD